MLPKYSTPAPANADPAPAIGMVPPESQREHLLRRFRRCSSGSADQALRSALLAYLTESRK
jgi:hypothetical protein